MQNKPYPQKGSDLQTSAHTKSRPDYKNLIPRHLANSLIFAFKRLLVRDTLLHGKSHDSCDETSCIVNSGYKQG